MGIGQALRGIGKALRRAVDGGQKWREIYVAPQMRPETVVRRYHYLRQQGVRCILYNLPSPSPRFGYTGQVSLRVHRDDVGRAYALLRDMAD